MHSCFFSCWNSLQSFFFQKEINYMLFGSIYIRKKNLLRNFIASYKRYIMINYKEGCIEHLYCGTFFRRFFFILNNKLNRKLKITN
jgi:hypothetical protein